MIKLFLEVGIILFPTTNKTRSIAASENQKAFKSGLPDETFLSHY